MRKYLICLLVISNVFIAVAKSQNNDTLFVKAKILNIDTIDYYVVIRAVSEDKKKMTILSPIDVKNPLIEKFKHSCSVKVGCNYDFTLQVTSRIKNGEGSHLFISLRKFDYNGKHFLDEGELPYTALNMYRFDIYH
jgi:hypothetical protein